MILTITGNCLLKLSIVNAFRGRTTINKEWKRRRHHSFCLQGQAFFFNYYLIFNRTPA